MPSAVTRPVSGKPRKRGCVMSATPEKHSRIAMPTALHVQQQRSQNLPSFIKHYV